MNHSILQTAARSIITSLTVAVTLGALLLLGPPTIRTFALALIKGGRDRIGERLYAPVGDQLVPVTVASPVLYDPEGARRDG